MRFFKASLSRHPVASFFLLTYLFSWVVWIFGRNWALSVGTFGPALVALSLTWVLDGAAGLRDIWRRLLIWRVKFVWYLFSFCSTAMVVLLALWLYLLGGERTLQWNDPRQWYLTIVVFGYVLFTSVLGEEIGWRGFALPRLQSSHGDLVSSLTLGLAWGLWHLPLFFLAGNFHQHLPVPLFLLQSICLSILYTWLHNHTQGSLLLPHLFHAASNVTLGVLPILPEATGGDLVPLWMAVLLLLLLTSLLVARRGIQRF